MQDERNLDEEARDGRRCVHCGARFNQHRGGHPGEPKETRRKCPPLDAWGLPAPYPRLTKLSEAEMDAAVDRYWSAETVFRPLPGQALPWE